MSNFCWARMPDKADMNKALKSCCPQYSQVMQAACSIKRSLLDFGHALVAPFSRSPAHVFHPPVNAAFADAYRRR